MSGKNQKPVVTQESTEDVRYIGHYVSEQYDPLEFEFVKKCKGAVRVSKDYWKLPVEDSARLSVLLNQVTTYDIGLEMKEMSKEFKDVYKQANWMVFNDKTKKSKFTAVPRKE